MSDDARQFNLIFKGSVHRKMIISHIKLFISVSWGDNGTSLGGTLDLRSILGGTMNIRCRLEGRLSIIR